MNKENRGISQRDKKLLVLLAAVVIGFLCYQFIISPALDQGALLQLQLIQKEVEYTNTFDLVQNIDQIKISEEAKKTELKEKYAQFFYSLNQERIIYRFDTLINESGAHVISIEFDEPLLVNGDFTDKLYKFDSYPLLDSAVQANPALEDQIIDSMIDSDVELPTDVIPCYTITLNIKDSTYPSVIALIQSIEKMDKAFIITKFDLHEGEDDLNGQIMLQMFSLPKVDETDRNYLKFVPSVVTGRDNPF